MKAFRLKKALSSLAMGGIGLLAFLSVFSPLLAFAQTPNNSLNLGTPPTLIVCGTASTQPCTFTDLITLLNNGIKFMIYFSVPIALIGISYAGWLYLTAAGNTGNINDAHKILTGLMWGFIWILVAYALVYTILNPILNTGAGFQLFNLGGSSN